MLDWLRLWPELLRLNLEKARHVRRLRKRRGEPTASIPPAPCQSGSDSGRAGATHCEACLRLDRSSRYRFVCPALRITPQGAFCSLDSAEIRPDWTRLFAAFALPPLTLAIILILGAWGFLRYGAGLRETTLADVAWPPRWPLIVEHRRTRFHDIAMRALAAGDVNSARLALFTAAQTGTGTVEQNQSLARLAAMGGYHSLADEFHLANLRAHPDRAAALAVAWHDDLLLSGRPRQLAHLALDQLSRPDSPREFWLHALFESIRHPGVAADLLATPPPSGYPHPGIHFALAARQALDRKDHAAAADQLIAFSGQLPGESARRFLVMSWLDAGDLPRAQAAALSTRHPAPPGEIAALCHALLRASNDMPDARQILRPVFAEASLRPLVLAALVRDPDADLLREFAAGLPDADRAEPRLSLGIWLAARRAGAADLADSMAAALEKAGRPLPAELREGGSEPARLEKLTITAYVLPLHRELLYALHEAR